MWGPTDGDMRRGRRGRDVQRDLWEDKREIDHEIRDGCEGQLQEIFFFYISH